MGVTRPTPRVTGGKHAKTSNTKRSTKRGKKRGKECSSPPYQILSLPAQMHIVRDDQVMRPVDDLLIRLMRGLRTEGWVSNETFKHDRAQRPPVTLVTIALLQENLGSDIIRRSDRRICLYTKGGKEREETRASVQMETKNVMNGKHSRVSYGSLSRLRSGPCSTWSNGSRSPSRCSLQTAQRSSETRHHSRNPRDVGSSSNRVAYGTRLKGRNLTV